MFTISIRLSSFAPLKPLNYLTKDPGKTLLYSKNEKYVTAKAKAGIE